MVAPKKYNVYEEVTNKIIEALEAGTNPWAKPWAAVKYGALRNADTNRPYRGLNTLLLSMSSMAKGYFDPRWLTYKNAEKLGGSVRKGEKGTQIIFWNFITPDANSVAASAAAPAKKIPFVRAYTVFNVQQCDGLKLPDLVEIHTLGEQVNTAAEEMLSIANIVHGGDRACYSPSEDRITMPAAILFNTPEDYYAAALHELTHWTGHKERLARDLANRFGEEAYAFEELVAEIGAAFFCANVNIAFEGMQHPEYINNWLKVMRGDNRAIFTAASKAQQAVDYVLEKSGISETVEEEEAA